MPENPRIKQKPVFRFAARDDAPLILEFIKGLAEHEKMLAEVQATPELLEHWLFDKQTAEVLFAVMDEKEVGFALYFSNFSTFLGKAGLYLEDIFVLPEYRRRGIGKALLAKLACIAVERGYGRMEWACLDWNEPSIDFYRSIGADDMSEWTTYRLTGSALTKLAEANNEANS
ncbi:MAG: GNAT family N-acetyltransferase [Oscillospiraceae bacterium]|nr:GNAT family N-acetyltransferase [Oscillospiraceae bacterium]